MIFIHDLKFQILQDLISGSNTEKPHFPVVDIFLASPISQK